MKFLRYLIGFPVAVIVTSLLFLLMYHLIREENTTLPEAVEDITDTLLPKRTPPPPPPDEKIEPPVLPEQPDPLPQTGVIPNQPPELDPAPPKGPGLPEGPGGRANTTVTIKNTAFYPLVTIAPAYPASCAGRGVEGEATVEFDVTNAGNVINARIIGSTDSCFERAALRAIENWKFTKLEDADPDAVRERGLRRTFVFELEE